MCCHRIKNVSLWWNMVSNFENGLDLNIRRETVINQSSTLSTVDQTDDCLLNKIM